VLSVVAILCKIDGFQKCRLLRRCEQTNKCKKAITHRDELGPAMASSNGGK
jgi:hypothetical protein